MNTIKGFIEALRKNKGYCYLACNSYKMSREEIKRISLELIYELTNDVHEPNINNVIEELEEYYYDELHEEEE